MQTDLMQSTLSVLGRNALLAIACVGEATSPGLARSVRDRTLASLVAKGHGLDAICAFLGLLQVDLLARVCALNLSTPHNGSVRRRNGNRNAWQLGEIRQLIEFWEQNLSSASIAVRFGRSPGAVRAKARWLGLARRPYRDIITDMSPAVVVSEDTTTQVPPAKRRHTKWDNDLCKKVILRHLAYQHFTGIARDLGLTPGQVRSKTQLLSLPPDRERHLQSMDYLPDTPHAQELLARFIIRDCPKTGQVYAMARRGGKRCCPAYYKTDEFRYLSSYVDENYSVSHFC